VCGFLSRFQGGGVDVGDLGSCLVSHDGLPLALNSLVGPLGLVGSLSFGPISSGLGPYSLINLIFLIVSLRFF
jgi:hypothetical protein